MLKQTGKKYAKYRTSRTDEITRRDAPDLAADDRFHASCFFFKRTNTLRIACNELVDNKMFEIIVLLVIAANSVTLAMYDPLEPDSDLNSTLVRLYSFAHVVAHG